MPRFTAFLRAINVGGGRTAKMDTLRRLFESLGFSEVETFIASGNVVFKTRTRNSKALESKIEQKLRQSLGYDVAVFVRTGAELARIVRYEPFPDSKRDDALIARNVIFLADALDRELAKKVKALKTVADEFRIRGRETYWLRRRMPGTPFSTVPLERVIGRRFTIRSSNTVKKIADKFYSTD
jgi:uncharacterized protein (DUF1697 family)